MTATAPRLLAFAGSLRQGSFNRRLIHVLAEGARNAGAEVTLIELRDYRCRSTTATSKPPACPNRCASCSS
jgi:NAD(P)H-dependent FMN reductase